MGNTLSYHSFILGLICVAAVIIVFFYFIYRKNNKLHDIIHFIRSPQENCTTDLRVGSVMSSFLWYLIITLLFGISYHFVDLVLFNESLPSSSISDIQTMLPLGVILIIPPLLEETAFRLPLKRKRIFITLSITAITFILSAPVFSTSVYEIVWQKPVLCAVLAIIFWFWGYKWIQRADFRIWFWLMTILFSILHIMNYDLSTLSFSEWERIILMEAIKIPSALLLGYTRLKHGFFISVAFHLLNNLTPFILKNFI